MRDLSAHMKLLKQRCPRRCNCRTERKGTL